MDFDRPLISELPTLTFPVLVHVGAMDKSQKRGWSLEGDGLSVSDVPRAWVRIAKLGGLPWWRLMKEDNLLLDAHALHDSQREEIVRWGLAQGFVRREACWRVSSYGELGDEIWTFASEAEAREEAFDGDEIVPGERTVATDDFPDRAGRANPEQVLVAIWAEQYDELDEVWWADDLEPGELSAPRGVLFLSRLDRWSISAIEV